MNRFKILLLIFLILSFVTKIFSITVTNDNDSGAGSFRQAIIDTLPGGTIDFAIGLGAQTITLLSALPIINKQLIIQGLNDGIPVTIDGNNITNIGLEIDAGGSGTEISNLIFENFTGTNGTDGSPGGNGQEAIGIYINGANNCSINSVEIQNIIGGNGGNGVGIVSIPGGHGGFAAGIRINNGNNNALSNCLFENINGGNGGNGGPNAGNGGNGGFAAGISLNIANNNIISACNFTNNFTGGLGGSCNGDFDQGGIGGDAICILLDSSSNNQITANVLPNTGILNGGDGGEAGNPAGNGGNAVGILLRQSSNNTINNNNIMVIVTGGTGGLGNTNLAAPFITATAGNGGVAGGIMLDNSSINNINGNSIDQTSVGGNGGSTANRNFFGVGGNGGPSAAILLRLSNQNFIISNTVNSQNSTGGNGGDADVVCGDVLGTGGHGGDAGAILLLTSGNNEIISNTLTNQTSIGGLGGAGSCQIAFGPGDFAWGQSGNGGNATVILLRQSSSNNTVNENLVQQQSLTAGNGGNGVNAGNGGNGGNAASVLLADSSNNNSFQENSFFLGITYVPGTAGAGGNQPFVPLDGSIANIFVTSITNPGQPITPALGNSILNNYIEGNATIFGINLFNGGNNNQVAPQLLEDALFCPSNRELTVHGTLPSSANGVLYLIQVFNNQTNADPNQGRFFLGEFQVLGTGAAVEFTDSFMVPMAVSISVNDNISATATNTTVNFMNTSEFSNIEQVSFLEPATAQNNAFTICQDTLLNGQLMGSGGQFEIVTPPANGTVVITDPNMGLFTYTPNAGFIGQDSFTFISGVGGCPSLPATITIDVLQRAIADDKVFNVCQDTTLNDNLSLTPPFQINSQPTNGTVLLVNPNTGDFIYTPDPGFIGQDSFTFIAGIGTFCPSSPATVTINVIRTPIAVNSEYQICQDSFLLENLLLTPPFEISTGPSNGTVELINPNTGRFLYTPNAGFIGQDSFTFIAGVEGCSSLPATITIDVLQRAIADNKVFQICQDTPLNGNLSVTAPFQIDSQPTSGTVILVNPNTGEFIYTPNPGFFGEDSFTFIAGAGGLCPSSATIAINVIRSVVAQQFEFTTCLNQSLNILAPGLLMSNLPISPVNQPVELQLVANPSFGSVTLNQDGSFVYRPAFGFIGQDSFVYRLIPGQGSPCLPSEALVMINVRQCCSINAIENAND